MKLTFLFIAFFPFQVIAQSKLNYEIYNSSNGLPQSTIQGFAFDKYGYLWLGTHNGLVKYDGRKFEIFNISNTSCLKSNNIVQIFKTSSDQKIYARDNAGTVYDINGKAITVLAEGKETKYTYFRLEGTYPSTNTFLRNNLSMMERVGNYRYDKDILRVVPVDSTSFLESGSNQNVCLYKNNSFAKNFIFNRDTSTSRKKLISISGTFFAVTNNLKFHKFKKQEEEFVPCKLDYNLLLGGKELLNIEYIYTDICNGNTYWIIESKLFKLRYSDPDNAVSLEFIADLPDNILDWKGVITSKYSDKIFLSTFSEGLVIVQPKHIKTLNIAPLLKKKKSLLSNYIPYSISRIDENNAITSTGIDVNVKKSITYSDINQLMSNRETIYCVNPDTILFVQLNRVYCFNLRTRVKKEIPISPVVEKYDLRYILLVYFRDDFLFISTQYETIIIPVLNNWQPDLDNITRCGNVNRATFIEKTAPGEFTIACLSGLYKLQQKNRLFTCTAVNGLENMQVRHFCKYKEYTILPVFNNGLFIAKNNNIIPVPVEYNYFPGLRTIHNVYIDSLDYLWVATNSGLYKTTINSVIESAETQKGFPYFYFFGQKDGIDNIEFNGSGFPNFIEVNKQRLIYPGMGGYITFNPFAVNSFFLNSELSISEITPNSVKLINDRIPKLIFNEKIHSINLDISAPFFNNNKNLQMEYKIDDSRWQLINTEEAVIRISLLNLDADSKKLSIRYRNGFELDAYRYFEINLEAKHPVYKRWWFFVLLSAMAAGIILMINHARIKAIKKRKKELEKKVQEQTSELVKSNQLKELLISIITHDMLSPLRYISLISGILRKEDLQAPKANQALSDIKSTSDKILTNSVNIINWIKFNSDKNLAQNENSNLKVIITEILSLYTPIAKELNVELKNNVENDLIIDINKELISIIIQNLISNALVFTKNGVIEISFSIDNGIQCITVKDNGSGMTPESLEKVQETLEFGFMSTRYNDNGKRTGLGYVIISDLIRMSNISVAVTSTEKTGTTVKLYLNGTKNQ
jgi:signal transduction histidine kinase